MIASLVSFLLFLLLPHTPHAQPQLSNHGIARLPPPAIKPLPKPPLVASPPRPAPQRGNLRPSYNRLPAICRSCQDENPSPLSSQSLVHADAMDRAYGSQALTYDDSFHPTLAADYVKWANLEPGQNVLDMACGTGLVTLAAKQAVGPTGTVVGIDITPRMLAEARRKAQAAHEDITFLRADVTDLARLPAPITTKFDVITCACAFVLLTDRVETLRQWATYLKPQGRIILDIATETSRLTGQVLAMATRELGIDVRWSSTPAEIQETLVKVVARAALVPVRVFASPAYKVVEYDERGGRERLTRALERQFPEWLAVPEMEAKAEEIFRREFRKREVGGRVREDVWFMVGIVRMKERS